MHPYYFYASKQPRTLKDVGENFSQRMADAPFWGTYGQLLEEVRSLRSKLADAGVESARRNLETVVNYIGRIGTLQGQLEETKGVAEKFQRLHKEVVERLHSTETKLYAAESVNAHRARHIEMLINETGPSSSLRQRSDAWRKVVAALDQGNPGWRTYVGTGEQMAVAEIERLYKVEAIGKLEKRMDECFKNLSADKPLDKWPRLLKFVFGMGFAVVLATNKTDGRVVCSTLSFLPPGHKFEGGGEWANHSNTWEPYVPASGEYPAIYRYRDGDIVLATGPKTGELLINAGINCFPEGHKWEDETALKTSTWDEFGWTRQTW